MSVFRAAGAIRRLPDPAKRPVRDERGNPTSWSQYPHGGLSDYLGVEKSDRIGVLSLVRKQ